MTDFEDGIPSEEDLERMYGSKYLSAGDVDDQRIKTKIAKVSADDLRQQNGTTKKKAILNFTSLDKGLVLNATNKRVLVDALGRKPC